MGRAHRGADRARAGETVLRLTSIARYWHTLKHLRPVQLYARATLHLARARPDLSPAPAMRAASGPWETPARREASMDGPGSFAFLGVRGSLKTVGWDGPAREKLWRYNQHYFDDLNARDAAARREWHVALLQQWVDQNPPGAGTGWEPYPTSLRIVNWVKLSLGGGELPPSCIQSLAVQARWLLRRLERHLLGNHLFSNGKALVFAGLFFEGAEAERWLLQGLEILDSQMREQILADGGHFERSTMYHALALEDVLDLCNLFTCHARPDLSGRLERWSAVGVRMLEWLQAMSHPDGEIAQFNDAAFGIAPSPGQLAAYARRLDLAASPAAAASRWLADSGYVRLCAGRAVALLDLAPVGPDYLPGHAHADTLSFELSLGAQRVLVNTGTSCYGTSAQRLKERGTAAHNTVVVANLDSSEVWSGFRVARRARVVRADVRLDADPLSAEGAHDGYRRLPGSPIHQRRWELAHGSLVVQDAISPAREAEARFHFAPGLAPGPDDSGRAGRIRLADGSLLQWTVELGTARLEEAEWHPRFGMRVPCTCLSVTLERGASRVRFDWR